MNSNKSTVKIPFRTFVAGTLTAGAATIPISPNSTLCTRLVTLADTFEQYRMIDLKYRMHRAAATVVNVQAAGFIAGVTDTAPSSVLTVAETGNATILGGQSTIPSDWLHVPRQVLAGQLPFYKTVVGSPDTLEEIQGNLYVVGNATDAYHVEIRGAIEFKQPVDPANTPSLAVRATNLLDKEKARRQRLVDLASDTAFTVISSASMSGKKGLPSK
jgi:hypothetical protein